MKKNKKTKSCDKYDSSREFAKQLDLTDPLAFLKEKFLLPADGIYFQGNSIGPPIKDIRKMIDAEITRWGSKGMENLFGGARPWISYIDDLCKPLAKLVGACSSEVILMNALSVKIHLLLTSFYRPTKGKHKILIEYPAFSSDVYAIKSQMQQHGLDPKHSLVSIEPRQGEWTLRQSDIEEVIEREGHQTALIFFGGVNFITGQALNMERITAKAKEKEICVGFDLAHAIGNIPLNLHLWDVDFAVWCSYKYLSGGPGAIGGAYVHQKHHEENLPLLTGWWGSDPKARFQFHLCPDFIPDKGAAKWQISNPPILGTIPLEASLQIYEQIGMEAFRHKSQKMTDYLLFLLDALPKNLFEIITPKEHSGRGCQLSLLIYKNPQGCVQNLLKRGIYCIFRQPNILRIAPNPFYNTFEELWLFSQALGSVLE